MREREQSPPTFREDLSRFGSGCLEESLAHVCPQPIAWLGEGGCTKHDSFRRPAAQAYVYNSLWRLNKDWTSERLPR